MIDLESLQHFEYKGHMYTLKQIKELKANEVQTTTPEILVKRQDKINILKEAGIEIKGKKVSQQTPNEDLDIAYDEYIKQLDIKNGK
jgi:hypothetical protein